MAENLIYRLPPSFETVEQERQHRKERLAAALRIFGWLGFEEGISGHITARDPELTDHFWVNPFGIAFSHARVSDLILVNQAGETVEGRYPANPSAFAIHSRIHQARPDVVAAAHSHSIHGRALSTLGQMIEPLTQDACAFYEDHALFDEIALVVLEVDEGKRIATALGDNKAVILGNHGLLTVGGTVDAAAWWFISMERSAQAQLLAKAAGTVRPIPHEQAKVAQNLTGNPLTGWLNFQPMYDRIVRMEPELLD